MIEDDVQREVRAAREAYALLFNYDVRAMVADLRARDLAGDWPVVRHPARRPDPVAAPAAAPGQSRLERECAKLDPAFEKALAEEGLAQDTKEWPEY